MGLKQFKKNDQFWAINAHQFNLTIYWGKLTSSKKSKTINFKKNEDTLAQEQKFILQKINEGYQQFKGAKFKFNPKLQQSKTKHMKKKPNSVESFKTGFDPLDLLINKKLKNISHNKASIKINPGLKLNDILKFQDKIRKICKNPKYKFSKEYVELLLVCGGIKIEANNKLFWIFTDKEVLAQTKKYVHVPGGVQWEGEDKKNHLISTSHLFGFASTHDGESQWCFDTSKNTLNDHIFLFHQDNPYLAHSSRTQLPLYKNIKPQSKDLKAWLKKYFLK